MTPDQAFQVSCDDSLLFVDPVVADELGILEFRVEGGFAPYPNTIRIRIPGPPQVTGEHATDVGDVTATIRWSTDRPATSQVEYGLTSSYGSSTPELPSLVVEHEVEVTGLSPETTYHYRVISTDAFGNQTTGSDKTFTTLPAAPLVSDVHVEALTETSFVVAWTTSRPCDSIVEYGLNEDYGMETPLLPELVTDHEVAVEELTPFTTYHYRVRSTDEFGRIVSSDDQVVTTPTGELLMLELAIAETTATSAAVSWRTTNPATSWIAYGETSDMGSLAGNDSLTIHHRVELEDLEPNTSYRLRAFSVDQAGATVESDELGFTTPCAPLAVLNEAVTDVGYTSATVSWTTSAPADGSVEYGANENYGYVAHGHDVPSLEHEVTVEGLEPGSTYHMRALSTDVNGCSARSRDLVASTDIPPLSVHSVAVPETTATSATIAWSTSNPSLCQVEYGPTTDYGFETEAGVSYLLNHSVVVEDLAPRTLYHFRVRATDDYDQSVVSPDGVFITPDYDGPAALLIYDVMARQISPTHALICWQTNAAATSTVHYGTTEDCSLSVQDDDMVTNHCLLLTGLSPDTRYYYRVSSQSAGGLSAQSHLYSFTTPLYDQLAPSPPAGLSASPCAGGVSLSWEAGHEYDLEAFRVYRRRDTGTAFSLVAELPRSVTTYTDRDVLEGWTYEYTISALDSSGNESDLSQSVFVTAGAGQRGHVWVYPNPVADRKTTISFSAPSGSDGRYSVSIYDARGRLVRTVAKGTMAEQLASVVWDTKDRTGNPVSSGIYFCVVTFSREAARSKIMVMR